MSIARSPRGGGRAQWVPPTKAGTAAQTITAAASTAAASSDVSSSSSSTPHYTPASLTATVGGSPAFMPAAEAVARQASDDERESLRNTPLLAHATPLLPAALAIGLDQRQSSASSTLPPIFPCVPSPSASPSINEVELASITTAAWAPTLFATTTTTTTTLSPTNPNGWRSSNNQSRRVVNTAATTGVLSSPTRPASVAPSLLDILSLGPAALSSSPPPLLRAPPRGPYRSPSCRASSSTPREREVDLEYRDCGGLMDAAPVRPSSIAVEHDSHGRHMLVATPSFTSPHPHPQPLVSPVSGGGSRSASPSPPFPPVDDSGLPPIPLLPNGKPNKALISARKAFIQGKAKQAAQAAGGVEHERSYTPLIPGINDSPPQRGRGLTVLGGTTPGNSWDRPRSSSMMGTRSMIASPSRLGGARMTGASSPSPPASPLARGPSAAPKSSKAKHARSQSTIPSLAGISEGNYSSSGSLGYAMPVGGVGGGARIRIVPTEAEREREKLGVDSDEERGKSPKKRVLHPKPIARGGRARKAVPLVSRPTWTWAALKEAWKKPRVTRPVIGGKLALRAVLKYFPLGRVWAWLSRAMHSLPYQLCMLLLVLVSIFAWDLGFLLPSSTDVATSAIMFAILLVQIVDVALNMALHGNYIFCVYFWIDLCSIFSLVVDVDAIGSWDGLAGGWRMNLNSASTYSLGNRADGLGQLSSILRTLRILKLCRIVNLLLRKGKKKQFEFIEAQRCLGQTKPSSDGQVDTTSDVGWQNAHSRAAQGERQASFSTVQPTPPPSQLGTILSDTVSIRTMLLVVMLGCLVPVLVSNAFEGSIRSDRLAKEAGLKHMVDVFVQEAQANWVASSAGTTQTMGTLYQAFIASYPGSSLSGNTNTNGQLLSSEVSLSLYPSPVSTSLLVGNVPSGVESTTTVLKTWSDRDSRESLRAGLQYQQVSATSEPFLVYVPSGSGTEEKYAVYAITAVFDTRVSFYRTCWLHLLLSLLLILSYLASTLSLASAFSDLIIHPFERIVAVVWQLTRSLGIVKEDKFRTKNYGSASSQTGEDGGVIGGVTIEPVPVHKRIYRDMKTLLLPCKIRAYEICIIDDMISKLCRIFHVTSISRNVLLSQAHSNAAGSIGGGASSKDAALRNAAAHHSKSMRLLTGSRLTEISTPNTILTVSVSERPLERELKGIKGTLTLPSAQKLRAKHYGDPPARKNSISSAAGSTKDETSAMSPVKANETSQSYSLRASGGSQNGLSSPERSYVNAHMLSSVQSGVIASGHSAGLNAAAAGQSAFAPSSIPRSPPPLNRRANSKATMLMGFGNGQGGGVRGVSDILRPDGSVDESEHPELVSLDALLLNPFALTHYRQFLQSKHSVEAFAFYIQVLQYQQECLSRASFIYSHFIAIGCKSEINIPAIMREDIAEDLAHPGFHIFERAKGEVLNMLRGSFQEFTDSHYLLQYLAAKVKDRIVLRPGGKANNNEQEMKQRS